MLLQGLCLLSENHIIPLVAEFKNDGIRKIEAEHDSEKIVNSIFLRSYSGRRVFKPRAEKKLFDSGIETVRPHDLSSVCHLLEKRRNSQGDHPPPASTYGRP